MKNKKIEENIIIIISAMKKIMALFLGPFLTTYFIETSQDSIIDLSVYYIFSYLLLGLGSFIVGSMIKNKYRIGMFRVGVILNFIYIMSIIILKSDIVNHLYLIAILYGISCSAYYFPYNLFVINKIENKNRIQYTVKTKIILSIIGVVCPILLGTIISVTNYELTAIIILFISFFQIIFSFMITPEKEKTLSKFNLKKTWKKLKNNNQIKRVFVVEFFIGMNVNEGALEILMTILIFNLFKTNINLGIITSIATMLSIIFIHFYGRIYKNRDDKKIIILSSILPIISVFIVLIWRNNITVIIYNFCYVIFTSLLTLTREIRLFNLADSYLIDKDNQGEFFAIREGFLNCGRIAGYVLLLLVGISGSQLVLKIVMILLTLSILFTGLNIRKIEKIQ